MKNKELYELTNPQKSIWLTEQMYPNTNINNISGLVLIKVPVNLNLLKKAIYEYVKNTPALRLKITLSNDIPKQYISDFETFNIESLKSSFEDLNTLSTKLSKSNFNIIENNLFVFKFIELPNNNVAIFTNIHHIVSDAWSLSLYASDVINIYSNMTRNTYSDTDCSNFNYIDYCYSQLSYLDSNRYKKDTIYWNELLNYSPNRTYIKNNLPKVSDTTAKRKIFTLDSELLSQINDFCSNNSCSQYTFFVSILSIYLSKINETDNIAIETPILNRSSNKEKATFGMFINTLPFLINIDDTMDFKQFLNHVTSLQKSFFRHQKFPYSEIQNILKQKYKISENIFDVGLSYQNARHKFSNDNVNFETTWNFNEHTLNSLDIHFYDMNNTGILHIMYDYQVNKLQEQDIENIHNRLIYIIEQVLSSDMIVLESISILPENELNFINNIFNNTSNYYPKDSLIHDLIDLSAKNFPDSIALVHKNSKITYTDLKYNSDLIAQNLIKNGVKPHDCVSILFEEKDINLIYSMIGILKAGACFLSIYPEYPQDRIAYILENSNTKILITENKYLNKFNVNSQLIDDLKIPAEKTIQFPHINANDNCYIIYTSGSTGKPKGIQISHNNLVNFIYGLNKNFENTITNDDRFLSLTNISFDVFICEIFPALVYGASIYLHQDLNYCCESDIVKYIVNNKITFSYFPPSLLSTILLELKKYDFIYLNKILVGVEPIKTNILHEYLNLNSDIKIINGYGPSETTICCTMYKFNSSVPINQITPIGFPISNSQISIFNSNTKLSPIGEVGEIYVTGTCVGNGYLNNSELTNKHFDLKEKIFRTGDLAKINFDGSLIFIGRNDNQIKHRGYRIDLGEIENTLKTYPFLSNAFIIQSLDSNNNSILIAYITSNISLFDESKLRKFLSFNLPYYMIPNRFVRVDSFPLTPNGKIDRKLLVENSEKTIINNFVKPSTENEKILCFLWENVLNQNAVGITDNFFELGGDSLSAIKISTQAQNYGIKISSQLFYKFPTIKSLLDNISSCISVSTEKYIKSIPMLRNKCTGLSDHILLIGATGFLGVHILHDLLLNTSSKIYCLIRGDNIKYCINKLNEKISFYFGDSLTTLMISRVEIIVGDFCLPNLGIDLSTYNLIIPKIGTIINAAAIVKHLGNDFYFYDINVTSVKHLIDICQKYPHIHLSHISTISICTAPLKDKIFSSFAENDLFVGQNISENIYIRTKFEAEQLLSQAINSGLNISIFRVGNLTWRADDGKFQINKFENLFYNLLNFIVTSKTLPETLKDAKINLSPVDICSNAIISILKTNNKLNIYHIYNFNEITFRELVEILNQSNLNITFSSLEEFKNMLDIHSKYHNEFFGIFEYLEHTSNTYMYAAELNNTATISILKDLSFKWPYIDINYLNLGGFKNE